MARKTVALDDKYDLTAGRIYVSGTQALIRLALMQKARDRAAGHHTAGYVTGYRGSPLGGLDQQFERAARQLAAEDILFRTAINEDLAATALWGTQQAAMRGEGRFEGVFGFWYGKGPGVDRSGDAFRHANLAGTAPLGGVLALMGDDHTCESSTTAHQSEFAFVDAMMPILNPAGVQEILDFGLIGLALSRYAGVWAGLKCVKDTVESTATVDGRPDRVILRLPEFVLPPEGVSIRPRDHPLAQEARLHQVKLPAARAFLSANAVDRLVLAGGPSPRIGLLTTGKSHLDTLQALADLGLDEGEAARHGLRLLKIGCPWPLDAEAVRHFAEGLELVLVIEEKRALIEPQVKEALYGRANAPVVIGKRDEAQESLFQSHGALDSNRIALAIGRRLLARRPDERLAARLAEVDRLQQALAASSDVATRIPYFCPGCPHNSSTPIPEGSRAYAGIGCHYMVQWMDRNTEGYTQMGGEGANWIGEAPFSTRAHVFQNLGDGTYNHSGSMAIRAARAAGVTMTYKILFNDAVAMTGGQRNDGGLTVPQIAAQVAAEGVGRIAVVTDEPAKYPSATAWPQGTTIDHRDDLLAVERELAAHPGLSVLIYDQTCAAEKRRRRKRGAMPDPDRRVVINDLVCEGCGDCGVQSNCVAIQPLETEWGRKRRIDQSACNKDFSCLKGFCPSFVTLEGAVLRGARAIPEPPAVAAPETSALDGVRGILITGVGGTGVVTVGAILGMAAHLEGRGCGLIDMAGLAQKGGAVTTHLKLAPRPEDISTLRIAAGGADVLIGCDIVVAGSARVLAACDPARTVAVVNTHEVMPGDFARNADFSLPGRRLERALRARCRPGQALFLDAHAAAERLFGDSIAANLMMLGAACQTGAVPLSPDSLEAAIRLNGVAVAMNLAAFRWGRVAVADPAALQRALAGAGVPQAVGSNDPAQQSLETLLARRVAFLTAYQDPAYAERYRRRIETLAAREAAVLGTTGGAEAGIARVAAQQLFRLMAIKDEYEVARLYTDGQFAARLAAGFETPGRMVLHLAPPLLSRVDPRTGRPAKRAFGPWILPLLRLLAKGKRLRGTVLDLFGRTAERRMERGLLADYEATLDEIAADLTADRAEAARALVAWPEQIRGFGPVKEASVPAARSRQAAALAAFRTAGRVPEAAE
ncbi:indolepyruvate ferredoxin oxidoreductase family protein [Microvirga tunisiensis]|uniref:Indolepyruvate ferredoxin oxidoreductase family protein n=1 Tax=Pannonibacter tanglangensis TaxID=2750084 RepID=A0A7X5JA61_9HYPH|nr:indolepyruvate ferredoxin oxidoreductase family protein [Pannonibacter sp. XCT-53]NBN79692.1 indolepyruvate ferredoxin oxidoreductase family protein [Pannonibacter sp. XCT-53]